MNKNSLLVKRQNLFPPFFFFAFGFAFAFVAMPQNKE